MDSPGDELNESLNFAEWVLRHPQGCQQMELFKLCRQLIRVFKEKIELETQLRRQKIVLNETLTPLRELLDRLERGE